jgi:hypothetical protein
VTWVALLLILVQQPNLEQQARLSLDKADKALADAKAAYAKHDMEVTRSSIQTMLAEVESAEKALADTRKDARRNPKHFKLGEMRTREMLKRIDSLENDMDIDERSFVAEAKVKVQAIHDEWLLGIMGAK